MIKKSDLINQEFNEHFNKEINSPRKMKVSYE